MSAEVDPAVAEAIDRFVEEQGYLKWRAIVAGMDLLRSAPADLQKLVMNAGLTGAKKWFKQADRAIEELNIGPREQKMLEQVEALLADERARREREAGVADKGQKAS